MAVILPSLSSLRSGSGCSLALMKPPITTAVRDSAKTPVPLSIVPMMPPDFLGGGGGASATSSAIVRFQVAVTCRTRIEQVLCQTRSSTLCSAYSATYRASGFCCSVVKSPLSRLELQGNFQSRAGVIQSQKRAVYFYDRRDQRQPQA